VIAAAARLAEEMLSMLKPSMRAWSLVAFAVLLSSCTTMRDLKAPNVELVGIQVLSSDMFAQRFRVRARVHNPNDIELPVRGLDYQIFMMGDSFAEGVSSESFVLPALGDAEFDMVVTTNFVSSFGRLLSRVTGGKLKDVEYEITGKVLLEKGMMKKIPFNHRGTVDFSRALQ
jgi:LEA14-like dessication related protein